METQPLTTTVSLSQKVNLGNYESADLFMSISGVSVSTTPEEIEEVLDAGRIAYDKMRVRMASKVQEIKPGKAR